MQNNLFAIIDVGSNSALLTIAEKNADVWENKIQKTASVRLGEDLKSGKGSIGTEAVKRLKDTLIRYRQTIHNVSAQLTGVVLTEAVRKADNQSEILEIFQRLLNVDATILTGEEEAQFAWLSVAKHHKRSDFCALDIGAGSSEICLDQQGISLPLGALRLAKEKGAFPAPSILGELKEQISKQLVEVYSKKPLYISGGTASALVMILEKMSVFEEKKIEGYALSKEKLDKVLEQFMGLSAEVIAQFPGLDDRRGEIFIPGLRIIQAWWEVLQPSEVFVSTLGIRLGALVHFVEGSNEAQ